MEILSDLPRDLAEVIFAKLPVTSLRAIRLTCRRWKRLINSRSFAEKHIGEGARESMVIMVMGFKVYLIEFNLHNEVDIIKCKGKLICQDNILKVLHCDGLLLCITEERLVVWNPYLGQTRWIEPRYSSHEFDSYAIGYEEKNNRSSRSYKILRFLDSHEQPCVSGYEIYDFKCNSWRILLGIIPDFMFLQRGVPFKGNTYYLAAWKRAYDGFFLICFDFTSESFGSCLRFPFDYHSGDTIGLSTVREEQVTVLFTPLGSSKIEIWITTDLNPNGVLWSNFLAVDLTLFFGFYLYNAPVTFFIDDKIKKKAAIVIDEFDDKAYIIEEDGYFREVEPGQVTNISCYYVPSFVHINQSLRGKRKYIIA